MTEEEEAKRITEMHRKYIQKRAVEERDEYDTIREEQGKGYITDEEADIRIRKLEDNHMKDTKDEVFKHFKVKFPATRPILPKRPNLYERWDLLPAIALREVAEIMYRGLDKHPKNDWKEVDFNSEQSPLNRAIAHAYKATGLTPHSNQRTQELAKAACRLLMQLWWELQNENDWIFLKKEKTEDENNS